MGQVTNISWCDHTFNPWIGCQKVSPACDNCYAESWAKRSGLVQWGPQAERRMTSDANWRKPIRWNKDAQREGVRKRVFCASLADVFDNHAPLGAHARLWDLIKQTPTLDWLLLTKRPTNIPGMLPFDWADGYHNVWLGVTAEDQERAEQRIPVLQGIPAVVRFVSMEPLLGPVNIEPYVKCSGCGYTETDMRFQLDHGICRQRYPADLQPIDWVILGGESGANARPTNPQWFRDIVRTCEWATVPVHFKQNGEWVSVSEVAGPGAFHQFPDGRAVRRTGRKRAGRTLDGVTHDGLPTPRIPAPF